MANHRYPKIRLNASVPGAAAAVVEEVAGDWLKRILGLPTTASFALASGCQMAHATCLAAARYELLRQRSWNVERDGLSGAPPIRVLASNRHGSVERAVRLLGIGERSITDLPLNNTECTASSALEAALHDNQDHPVIVILQAGDLNTGSFDRYRELNPRRQKSLGMGTHRRGVRPMGRCQPKTPFLIGWVRRGRFLGHGWA
jgi:glutamate/tyrosine decarboxylase-like PLP-dependent enzyme